MVNKIPVGVLGATGVVGQKFVEFLSLHPWFMITALAASDRSCGKPYRDVVRWLMPTPLLEEVGDLEVMPCVPSLPCEMVFSALDATIAGEIEEDFAYAGYVVLSNSRNHRLDPYVPLLVPEINSSHLALLEEQPFGRGKIITNPNCTVIGLSLALKPLLDVFGIEKVHVVTLQALSGAGYPGLSGLDVLDNVIPFISGEEEKIEREPLKILGSYAEGRITPSTFRCSAQCNRVSVTDGHIACISLQLGKTVREKEIIEAWQHFRGEPQHLSLPSAPSHPLIYLSQQGYPQPKLHRLQEKGMAVSIGGLRPCSLFGWKFTVLSHNTIRGAAGTALLNAELIVQKGLLHKHHLCPLKHLA